ncbi:MAG TPA: thiamine pyrophosphate-binding protein [Candidatus Acidoferrum sp.]|nr:thiamine pyrophosphate-binding protein [Candidatus Acidoferrum sp.]
MIRTGGQWVVEALRAEGVRHVFGIPGVHNLGIYDALLGQSEIAHVLARHEAGAAFMADGYARSTGRPGVAIVTSGPGATNTMTPLVEAYAGSMPVVVIMSDIQSTMVGRDAGSLHEVPNQIECFRPVTRMAEALTRAEDIPGTIAGAFDLLRTGRPGPVAISIPFDFLNGEVDAALPARGSSRRPPCHVADIERAVARLRGARRPLLVAGGGVVSAGAEAELRALAQRLGAPVLTTVMGRGAIGEDDPLWHAVMPNKRATEEVFQAADVVLVVGCRLAARSTQGLLLNLSFTPEQTLIHLDIDPTVIGKLFAPEIAIVGDAKDGLARIVHALGPGPSGLTVERPASREASADWDRAWLARLKTAASPRYTADVSGFIHTLRAALPPEAIVVNDQTGINYWMEWHFPVLRPRTFLYPVGSATLGYGLPAAIGAQIAHPDRPVVAVLGDGGFMFSVNELATAVKYRLPLAIVLMNDDRYGAIKWLQEKMFKRSGETDLANPDFPAMAKTFGATGERLPTVDALPAALARAFKNDGPTLLEVALEVEPPWEF